MPYIEPENSSGKKRKRADEVREKKSTSRKSSKIQVEGAETRETEILNLEAQILESRQHYNNIATLIDISKAGDTDSAILATLCLCRIFSRLMAGGLMNKRTGVPESELVIVQWLWKRLDEYVELLLAYLNANEWLESLKMLMVLVKGEVNQEFPSAWEKGIFSRTVSEILLSDREQLHREFQSKYFAKYDDVRFYTLDKLSLGVSNVSSAEKSSKYLENSIELLSSLKEPSAYSAEMSEFFANPPEGIKHSVRVQSAQKKRAQQAWLGVLASPLLSIEQRKSILRIMVDVVVPWFNKVELLMDFLTDSYNVGGATALLALSGLFKLMQVKNLDYPSFYGKLYSLLDEKLLLSKHRARFFPLFDEFLSSTHLPAALVASFVKRLARLALHAPPASIVIIVPWIYNVFKRHPQCSFLIHREPRSAEQKLDWQEHGFNDPFDMDATDPMESGAIDSSLWEIETLQSHYHPNIATLAKIISEQFTKQEYNMEDFYDHSYNSLIGAEVGREMKKTPIVEYQIPKHIFTEEGGELNPLGSLMMRVLETSKID